jgi:hypothetical protein
VRSAPHFGAFAAALDSPALAQQVATLAV